MSTKGHTLAPNSVLNGLQIQASGISPTGRLHTQAFNRRRRQHTFARAGLQPVVCVTSVSESTFEQEVLKEKDKVVLVDFWASWCGPCKLIDPFMKQVEEEFSSKLKVVKVEADPNPTLVEKYKVYGLPTLILFKDGSMVKGSLNEGAITKPALLKYLEKYGIAKEVAK